MNDNTTAEEQAKTHFEQLKKIPHTELWPVVVGLLQHLLLDTSTTSRDYCYGVFAVTDTLRDAAYLQKGKGGNVALDIDLLTSLRWYHLAMSIIF